MLTQAPRGTRDVLPTDSYRWQYVEAAMRKAAAEAGYREVRTPVFEHTELFLRGIGDTTDVVQKEMYTFEDRGHRSLTLRPEGTAGVIRAIANHGLEQGDEALKALTTLFTHSTLPNLLDNHPPFQIDGNFGSLAAIIRMLVQSEFNEDGTVSVKLLPALPTNAAWQEGSLRGVGIKGGWYLNFDWKNGKVCNYELVAGKNAIEKDRILIKYFTF